MESIFFGSLPRYQKSV